MTRRDQEQLLAELLGGEEAAGLREATLTAGLKAMRWKRRRRLAAYVSVLVLPWAILLHPTHQQKAVVTEASAKPAEPKVEEITTEELFALFPNRPVALVGKPGEQQLVFLDQPQQGAAGE